MSVAAPIERPAPPPTYVTLFEIARGGMGRVDLALQRAGSFRRLCALKRLHPHHAEDAGVRAMFLEEARLAGLIRHPNVVSVFDVREGDGHAGGSGPFFAMDYVEGASLSHVIARARGVESALSVALAARIGADVARGLHAAHELRNLAGRPLGLVHRDVSPQNVLVGYDGLARLTDFGIAKALDAEGRTRTGILKGKMGYMAPEQLRFEPIDRRSDLFALGVVLFEALSGRRLYGGDAQDAGRRILREAAPDVGLEREDVPGAFVELLFELLAKDAGRRPAEAAAVAARLDAVVEALAEEDGPADLGEAMRRWFADERAVEAARVAAAVADVERGAVGDFEATAETPPRRGGSARARSRAWRWVAAAVALGGAAAGASVVATNRDAHVAPAPRAEVAPPAMTSPAPALPAAPAPALPVAAAAAPDLPVAAGPVAAGPVAAGPVTAGPVAAGPVAAGPVAVGPVAAAPAPAGPVAVPTAAEAPSAPANEARPSAKAKAKANAKSKATAKTRRAAAEKKRKASATRSPARPAGPRVWEWRR